MAAARDFLLEVFHQSPKTHATTSRSDPHTSTPVQMRIAHDRVLIEPRFNIAGHDER